MNNISPQNAPSSVLEQTRMEFAGSSIPPALAAAPGGDDDSSRKASYKTFYDSVTAQLDATELGQFSYFLNLGFACDGPDEQGGVRLPRRLLNRNSARLVLEVIGDCPLDDKRVLDVGCGRGGSIHLMKTFFRPARLDGIDLSSAAIAFDRRQHADAKTRFTEGDAEHLPYDAETFDVVLNIESSHSYPNLHRFYSEVHRVLVPGGCFLYTDIFAASRSHDDRAALERIGFQIEHSRNITHNVLLSCNEIAGSRQRAFASDSDHDVLGNFLSMPGSRIYEQMVSGTTEYLILRLRKPL